MMQWHFRKQQPDEKVRNPIQGELFSDAAIDRPAQALVREAIQNSLDARYHDVGVDPTVTVRIYLSGNDKPLSAERAQAWFGGAWDHFRAPRSGLPPLKSSPRECPFLVVEDFCTTGLEGDPEQWQPPDRSSDNRFFAFFRAEGLSGKSGQQGGRWGVGKTVFPRTSGINTCFGLTVRRNDQRKLLLGQTTLFYHKYAGTSYASDGYFGKLGKDDLVLPIEDQNTIKKFEKDFVLVRGDEPGLSVVVPYVDGEISIDHIIRSVVQEYFQPVLLGHLIVRVQLAASTIVELNAKTLLQEIERLSSRIDIGLRAAVELAIWARDQGQVRRVFLNDPGLPPKWTPAVLPVDKTGQLATEYRQGQELSLRIPVRVRQANKPTRDSYCDVFLRRALNGESYLPTYIRNGIIIPRVRERQVRGHRILALVVADEEGLGTLLGDAEVPAHTHWSKHTQNVPRAHYVDGMEVLDFVSDAPRQLAELFSREQQQKDEFLLADLFPKAEAEGMVSPERAGKRGGKSTSKRGFYGKPTPPAFEIQYLQGGFCVRRNVDVQPSPADCHVAVAYDTSRGNPFKRYRKCGGLDFQLADLKIVIDHGQVVEQTDNTIDATVADDQFKLTVAGFDPNRDLVVVVKGGAS